MKTIGICIPTYERPEFLRRCLASIIDQANGLPIEIFVADDSCSDVNDVVIGEATRRFPALRHRKNETNLGINENIRHVVDIADIRPDAEILVRQLLAEQRDQFFRQRAARDDENAQTPASATSR
jgi:glycosyltransferase involved in cell wall biosynthesis